MDYELCDEWYLENKKQKKIDFNETIVIENHPKYHNFSEHKINFLNDEETISSFTENENSMNEELTCDEFYDKYVKSTKEQCDLISTYPQRSKEWKNCRKYCITASDFGTVLNLNKYESQNMLIRKKVFDTFKGNEYTEFGKQNEENAEHCFLEWFKLFDPSATFRKVNLIKFQENPWMAVSPDGLMDTLNGVDLVEFKCPAKKKDTNEHPYAMYERNTPPYYFAQIQGIAGYLNQHGLKINRIWFVVWQAKRTWITLHEFNQKYYDIMFQDLKNFYFNNLLVKFTQKYNNKLKLIQKGNRFYFECEDDKEKQTEKTLTKKQMIIQ